MENKKKFELNVEDLKGVIERAEGYSDRRSWRSNA